MALVLSLLLVFAQDASETPKPKDLPTGQVVDPVVCLHDPAQSYALYLPTSYRSDRPWPVLYAFDPAARGRVPVTLFREAAERLGYVVVGSNNSRNGPVEPVLTAIQAVWSDTHARLAVDPKRVYTTGMSGGTFPALALGLKQAAAVIACAGALDAGRVSLSTTDIDWLGIAGNADFNYAANKSLVRALAERGVVARFETFEGGHGWPPPDVVARSLEWLQLSAMRKRTRPADPTFIDGYRERGVTRAGAEVKSGRFDEAAEEYAALARELRGFESVADLEAEARRLRETREAGNERKREARIDTKYRDETRRLFALVGVLQGSDAAMTAAVPVMPQPSPASPPTSSTSPISSDAPASSMGPLDAPSPEDRAAFARRELTARIERLRGDRESANADRRIVARRVVDGFRISALYDGLDQLAKGRPAAAKVALEFCVAAQPDNANSRYELARAHAALRDKKGALAELRRAVAGGYRETERITRDAEWEFLRKEQDPEFLALVQELPASRAR